MLAKHTDGDTEVRGEPECPWQEAPCPALCRVLTPMRAPESGLYRQMNSLRSSEDGPLVLLAPSRMLCGPYCS